VTAKIRPKGDGTYTVFDDSNNPATIVADNVPDELSAQRYAGAWNRGDLDRSLRAEKLVPDRVVYVPSWWPKDP
jgi:hypothetical protein